MLLIINGICNSENAIVPFSLFPVATHRNLTNQRQWLSKNATTTTSTEIHSPNETKYNYFRRRNNADKINFLKILLGIRTRHLDRFKRRQVWMLIIIKCVVSISSWEWNKILFSGQKKNWNWIKRCQVHRSFANHLHCGRFLNSRKIFCWASFVTIRPQMFNELQYFGFMKNYTECVFGAIYSKSGYFRVLCTWKFDNWAGWLDNIRWSHQLYCSNFQVVSGRKFRIFFISIQETPFGIFFDFEILEFQWQEDCFFVEKNLNNENYSLLYKLSNKKILLPKCHKQAVLRTTQ